LHLPVEVLPLQELVHRVRPLAIPVRIVGGVEDVILADPARHVRNRFSSGSQEKYARPHVMYSLGLALQSGASHVRYSNSPSMCSIKNGTQPAPDSMKPMRKRWNFSRRPPKMQLIKELICSDACVQVCSAKKLLKR